MVGLAAMFAYAEATEVDGTGDAQNEGPFVEVTYLDAVPGDTVDCTALDVGYLYLEENGANDAAILSENENFSDPPMPMEPPGFNVYHFPDGKLPEIIGTFQFDEEQLALYGHAYGTLPLYPLPDEQLAIINNTSTDSSIVVVLENTLNGVHIDCTTFSLDSDSTANALGYYPDVTTQSVKKKRAIKKKVAKANKRKVVKSKAKKKAAAKKRKAAPKKKAG
jgi:hypothetical protein